VRVHQGISVQLGLILKIPKKYEKCERENENKSKINPSWVRKIFLTRVMCYLGVFFGGKVTILFSAQGPGVKQICEALLVNKFYIQ